MKSPGYLGLVKKAHQLMAIAIKLVMCVGWSQHLGPFPVSRIMITVSRFVVTVSRFPKSVGCQSYLEYDHSYLESRAQKGSAQVSGFLAYP
jgi:hypothetical protein